MESKKTDFNLTNVEEKKVIESLNTLKKKFKVSTCRKCSAQIKFLPDNEGKIIPHDMDGIPHWQTCPYSGFAQRKAAMDIVRKLATLYLVRFGLNIEKEADLTRKEAQVVHAILEKRFKDEEHKAIQAKLEAAKDESKVDSDVQFKPVPCDSVGDPDEDRAPDEQLIHEYEEKIIQEHNLDKGVKKVIIESE